MIEIPKMERIFGMRSAYKKIESVNISNHIFVSVKKGIKCIISNGLVRDESGKEFLNDELQEEARYFCERLKGSNMIAIGVITLVEPITGSFSDYARIESCVNTRGRGKLDISDTIYIEIYDILFGDKEPEMISYSTKRSMIMGMARNGESQFVRPSIGVNGDSTTKDGIMTFLRSSAMSGKTTIMYDKSCQDTSKSHASRCLMDLYEVVTGNIISYDTMDSDQNSGGEGRIKFIEINVPGESYNIKIPFIKANKKWSRYLNVLIREKLITKYVFKSIFDIEKNRYSYSINL